MIGTEGTEIRTGPGELPIAKATQEEPSVELIHQLSKEGLKKLGHHGFIGAMGVSAATLPKWDDIQIMTAQLATKPLLEDQPVILELIIGPEARQPLKLEMPIFISDMSFGALSEEAKVALSRGGGVCGDRDLFRRRGNASRGKSGEQSLSLRIGECKVRLS